jgi:hypothetical protein
MATSPFRLLENKLNFGIVLRRQVKLGNGRALKIDVEEGVHSLGSDREPAAPSREPNPSLRSIPIT